MSLAHDPYTDPYSPNYWAAPVPWWAQELEPPHSGSVRQPEAADTEQEEAA